MISHFFLSVTELSLNSSEKRVLAEKVIFFFLSFEMKNKIHAKFKNENNNSNYIIITIDLWRKKNSHGFIINSREREGNKLIK